MFNAPALILGIIRSLSELAQFALVDFQFIARRDLKGKQAENQGP